MRGLGRSFASPDLPARSDGIDVRAASDAVDEPRRQRRWCVDLGQDNESSYPRVEVPKRVYELIAASGGGVKVQVRGNPGNGQVVDPELQAIVACSNPNVPVACQLVGVSDGAYRSSG
jgi:hypothetical protein